MQKKNLKDLLKLREMDKRIAPCNARNNRYNWAQSTAVWLDPGPRVKARGPVPRRPKSLGDMGERCRRKAHMQKKNLKDLLKLREMDKRIAPCRARNNRYNWAQSHTDESDQSTACHAARLVRTFYLGWRG